MTVALNIGYQINHKKVYRLMKAQILKRTTQNLVKSM
jgi:hypothetical protein